MAVTQMMQQYLEIKKQYQDAILFFRLGDFYEMFYDDAKLASRELELTLTGRDCGEEERAPMCGVPFHSADTYIARLIAKGYKVAICEQMEDPALARGLVKRDIIRVVTPGTVIDGSMLQETKNNYIAAVVPDGADYGFAYADISTGEVNATLLPKEPSQRLQSELGRCRPSEILCGFSKGEYPEFDRFAAERLQCVVNYGAPVLEDENACRERMAQRFPDSGEERPAVISAVGGLLGYFSETQRTPVPRVSGLNVYGEGQYLDLDLSTRRNLELTETMRTKEKKGTLLWVLDNTRTSMGARLLRKWVEMPLLSVSVIRQRQEAVGELCGNFMLREEIAQLLRSVLDLERLTTRVVYGTAHARDLRAIANTLAQLPAIKQLLSQCTSSGLTALNARLDDLHDLCALLDRAVVEDPPFSVREGGFIAAGYHEEVDSLRDIMSGGKGVIEKIEAAERGATGIRTLKVGYNHVFGYYIEVSKSFLSQVPPHYIRKQTLANGERYITEELKKHEATVLGASDRLCALEYDLLVDLRDKCAACADAINRTAAAVAELDVVCSLGEAAMRGNYVCPQVGYGESITIRDGRHPVVEKFVRDEYFVPNDTLLDTGANRLLLITGPNMAGKSTYMRQVALIVLMAQIGSFVPAKEAEIGVVDRIFTRVGASDDLASGQSTFMLEMSECANILNHATRRSLIIYDEIGRGTSTYDGMSIAWAIAEYTLGKKIGAKTLFATHYHELTSLEGQLEGVVNYNIAAKKRGDDITFLRKIVRGAADDSYGIEVAQLAGVPKDVIRRAKEILKRIEDGEFDRSSDGKAAGVKKKEQDTSFSFDDMNAMALADRLRTLEVDTLSPLEALQLLYDLKKMVN